MFVMGAPRLWVQVFRIPAGRRFRNIAIQHRCTRIYSEYLPADDLDTLRYNIDAHVYAQNTSLQTFQTHCGITEMHTDVFRIPAGRRFRDNADFGGLTLGLRNVCLQVRSQNACLQVFAQNVCRHTFLNPKVKPKKVGLRSGVNSKRLPAGALDDQGRKKPSQIRRHLYKSRIPKLYPRIQDQ